MLPFQGADFVHSFFAGRCPALGYFAPSGLFIGKLNHFPIRDSYL